MSKPYTRGHMYLDIFYWKLVKFVDLNENDIFYCYGDQYINYDHLTWCECTKLSNYDAQEVDGVRFYLDPDDLVSIIDNDKTIKVIKKYSQITTPINITTDMLNFYYKKYKHLSIKESCESIICDNRDKIIKEILNDK